MSAPATNAEIEALLPHVMHQERAAAERLLARGRQGKHFDRVRLRDRLEKSRALREARAAAVPEPRFPEELPISVRAEEIIAAIHAHPVVILAGETGSGKTTQLPKMCLAAGLGRAGKIACTQPRRVAALSVSRRIAEELGVPWGREVGAKIRFTDRTGPETLVKMMTDGMLLAEIQADPELWEYDAILIDEAHERSLNIDFLLGYLQGLRRRRPELRILITSATIDTAAFSKAFSDAPVIEVSGRTYPVEIRYEPVDAREEERGDFTYLDGVARAVREVVGENRPGDILVFLPGEKDIRDLRGLLEGTRFPRTEVLPLFGRLSNEEQQRIFAPTQRRKIVLATNIAETSLTIPGIRYVIDTGLARVSRYDARTHTRRLPIEPIAQSSADQRAGRAGRVEAGVCIRLYAEKDYASRPRYATPELQRSNLAEVILRMIAFGLGRVEEFPFLDPPRPAAIRAGYSLLEDLGALDADTNLTPLGAELARLPCDPTVGRMLLQARQEGAVREILVIAAGLSIQDPRERPADAQEAADRMHARFRHPESDFLTLLNIWDAYHEQMENLTQNQLRKFCREHFLSYLRLREWMDVHRQLQRVMQDLEDYRPNRSPAEYFQVHRAILSGLLGNVAQREAGNHYRATRQRQVMLHPGSAVFDKSAAKQERKKLKGKQAPSMVSGKRTPPWVVCAEWMETSRLFARVVAAVEVGWIEDLGAHLLTVSHGEPAYDPKTQRVVVRERRHLYGLELSSRRVGYGRIDPEDARLIFIREGLVGVGLDPAPEWYAANQQVRAEVEEQQTRLREASVWQLDERLERFYRERLPEGISSLSDLEKWWRRASPAEQDRLRLQSADLLRALPGDLTAFPEQLEIEGVSLSLNYTYKPGEESDGATLRVPFAAFSKLGPETLDWAVPGYVRERVGHLLKGLPKETRRRLHPLGERAEELAGRVQAGQGTLRDQLSSLLAELYGVRVWPEEWDGVSVPAHLLPRVEVLDAHDRVVAEGRDWSALEAGVRAVEAGQGDIAEAQARARARLWERAAERHERPGLRAWTFPDQPHERVLGEVAGIPVRAWPGLAAASEGAVDLRLFESAEAARRASAEGVPRLVEAALSRELGWAVRDLHKELKRVKLGFIGFLPLPTLEREAEAHLRAHVLAGSLPPTLTRAAFEAACEEARARFRGWVPRFVDLLEEIIAKRRELQAVDDPHGIIAADLSRLLPVHFLSQTPPARLPQVPRWLEASRRRALKAQRDPAKDQRRAKELGPFERALAELRPGPGRDALRWALEEFRLSLFAQELGV
ncbi:MAG: ATP-dependent RNA helicase HrpA, partial [Opitutales bacterium]